MHINVEKAKLCRHLTLVDLWYRLLLLTKPRLHQSLGGCFQVWFNSLFSICILNLDEAPQTKRHHSTSKSKGVPSDAEIIEISDDDDDPPPLSISRPKSKSKSIKPFTKASLPKTPHEVIEIIDSDDEQLPSKPQLQEKNVGRSFSGRLPECTKESSPRRDQSRPISLDSDSFEGSDGNADMMNIDGGDFFNIPSSPPALSQDLQVTDDINDSKGAQSIIPLPSSSPSSVGLSPKGNHLSTPPAPSSSINSLTISSPRRQTFPFPTRPNTVKKPISAGPSIGTSTGSSSSRLGFSTVPISSSSQAPPPADKHRRQFARKMAMQSMPNEDEDAGGSSSESEGNTKANKGKEKEIRESSSSSGTESINMRGLQDALAMGSDMLKQRPVSPTLPKKQGQTLAEAITSAGQLNRTKKGRRLRREMKNVPVDPASDDEAGFQDGPTADENEKALKAAIGSSRLLVNLLPALKEKRSVSAAAAAAKGDYMVFIPTVAMNRC
jgi:hypothetical protein